MAIEPKYFQVYQQTNKNPEMRLWQAVMLLFIQDMQKAYDLWRESLNGQRPVLAAKINSWRAQVDNSYTEYLCVLADIEYCSFRKKAIAILEGRERVDLKNLRY